MKLSMALALALGFFGVMAPSAARATILAATRSTGAGTAAAAPVNRTRARKVTEAAK